MACMQHSVGDMFYSKTREAQQSVVLDNWKHPERKEQEMLERTLNLAGNLNG